MALSATVWKTSGLLLTLTYLSISASFSEALEPFLAIGQTMNLSLFSSVSVCPFPFAKYRDVDSSFPVCSANHQTFIEPVMANLAPNGCDSEK